MKTLKDEIAYYKRNFTKVAQSHGIESDAALYAMFILRAVSAGMPRTDAFNYAAKEVDKMHEMELAQCDSILS